MKHYAILDEALARVLERVDLPDSVPVEGRDEPHEVTLENSFSADVVTRARECDPAVGQGWLYDGQTFTAPPPAPEPPAPVPTIISDRQFAQQAAIAGLITQDEALAWVGPGTIPTTMTALVDKLPEAIRFGAKMMLSGATTFDRTHPLTLELVQAFGWTDAERDGFWTAAAAL